jgi:hypothetical protein
MQSLLITNRFYISGAITFRDSMPDDGYSYTYDQILDAYRRVETSPPLAASGWVDFSDVATDGHLITIGGRKYECNVSSTSSGTADVDITLVAPGVAATVDAHVAAIADAINADPLATVVATADTTSDSVFLYAKVPGTVGNAITLTTNLTNGIASAATLTNGQNEMSVQVLPIAWTLTAAEATSGVVRIRTPLTEIKGISILMSDGGVLKTPDSTVAITAATGASIIKITEGTTPAWAASDVLYVTVIGTM